MIKQNNVSINIVGYIMILLLLIPNECKINGNYAICYLILGLFTLMIFWLKGKIHIPPLLKRGSYNVYYVVIFLLYLLSGSTVGAVFYLVRSFCIVLLMYNAIRTCNNGDKIFAFIAKICGCLAVLGIIETFTGFNIFDFLRNTTAIETGLRFGLHRSRGMMVVPHNYGAFLMFASIVVFYVWQKEKNFKAKRMYCAIYILVFINEMLTFTRATMAVFIVLQICLGILSGKITKPIRILQGIAVLVIGWIVVEVFDISIIKSILNNFTHMFLAMFDPSTASNIATEFGVNASGVGQRNQLYEWITEAVKGHEILGLGATAKFERVINAVFTKTSIENQYLSLLYRFGWVGLGLYIIMSITLLQYFWKNRNVGYKINGKLSLNVMFLLCFISYYILMFTFAEIDEIYFIHSLLGIIFAINKISEKQCGYEIE